MERDREVDTYKTVSCLAAMMSLSITNIKPVVSSQLSIRKHDRVCGKTIYEQKTRPEQKRPVELFDTLRRWNAIE